MSDDAPRGRGGFTPATRPARLTIAEFSEFAGIIEKIIERSRIRWLVYAAGVASIVDIFHNLWLAARFVFKF